MDDHNRNLFHSPAYSPHASSHLPAPARHPKWSLHKLIPNFNLGEDIDFAVGAIATALTGSQLAKAYDSNGHKFGHLIKAGFGAVAAVFAFLMMQQEHNENRRRHNRKGIDHSEEWERNRRQHHEVIQHPHERERDGHHDW